MTERTFDNVAALRTFWRGMKSIIKRTAAIVFLAAISIAAQTAPPGQETRPKFDEFEVATIKLADPAYQGRWIRMLSANELAARNHSVKTLIAAAYNVSPKAISGGASWVNDDRYDIVARTPGSVRPNLNEQMAMLRKLLNDRFSLTFHREQKEMRAYVLTVAKGGPKLKETTVSPDATPEGPPPLIFVVAPDEIRLPARSATMAELAGVMQRAMLDDPVVDHTGLAARYDFDLAFSPDEAVMAGALPRPDNAPKPGLFTAIQQQLGLKIESTRAMVDTLVIDRAERPTAN